MAVMVVVAWLIERLVLGKLVNQEGVTLLMATLGHHLLPRRLRSNHLRQRHLQDRHRPAQGPDVPARRHLPGRRAGQQGRSVRRGDRRRAGDRAVAFFQYTPTGRALRAVADDHQAAQSIGIPLSRVWVIVWSVAGFVALVAGIIWGSKLGVQFSLAVLALKALPVVILGGLTSVPGAIIGGLIIGVGEKLSEVFVGPMLGGGIEIWFGYVLVLLVLLVRPQGLFGEKIIDRV
jgi:branched-chain amino acid transport system permease protein